jgi:hypothetical protein
MAVEFSPSAVRQVIRWCVLLGFVYLACWQLMSVILNVVFRAWQYVNLSDQDAIWMNLLALGHLLFSMGAVFTGIGLFRGIPTFPKVGRGALVLLAIGLLLIATSFIGYFYLKNRCSDQGGTWANDTMQCTENSRSLYEIMGQ